MQTVALGPSWLDPEQLIDNFGFAGLLLVIFAECGLLVGLVLPGDSLLFIAGLLISDGTLDQPLWLACVALWVAAMAGNVVGYEIGRRAGPAVFERPNSRIFKQEYVEKTTAFFDKHGPRAIVLARFVPIVRTLITFMAGTAKMDRRAFVLYSAIGGLLWAVGVTVLGHQLGEVDFVREHVELILLGVVALSVLPIVVHVLRERRAHRAATPETGDPVG
ncbi:VTT domain-containing protein [Sporichthya sp.]|uniref:DedA family protein n=1 Tax=Sporichthya sp. TaxID=65475 RepID=UPI00185C79D1|nr:VTT domain-containing protein [Sporichthya sp.]MBA3742056.1 VTT domain-containing protein [Sporichthya sp.]